MMVLESGLNGHPHSLYKGEAKAFEETLGRLGVRFLSKTKAAREGLELRRGAKPVVSRYYGAPIKDFRDLYCLEQFKPIKPTQQKGK